MLTLTNQSDYGILFISYLRGKKTYVPLSDLLKETNLPKRFLARIAANLVKHKLVESREGKVGGYRLAKNIDKVSLYDYLKIFEGELAFAKCLNGDYECPWDEMCQHKSFLQHKLNSIVALELKKVKLRDLFSNLKTAYVEDKEPES